jgi:methionyl aminopeptidase
MRESGKMLATVLQFLKTKVVSGISTKDLANAASNELKKLGGQPAFLGYQGFPDILCVSINDEVVHGIPRADKIINTGDIVSLDFGVKYKGMITDSALSVIVGKSLDKRLQELLKTTERSLMAGIDTLTDGVKVGTIASAIQKVLDDGGFGIVRELVGHGVGHELHEEPNIPNYGSKNQGPILKKGMTIAIEPMATLGTHQVYVASDGWTVLTLDHSWAVHFEHTVLIGDNGPEILTEC